MKNEKIKAPISLVIAICDKGVGEEVEVYFNNKGLTSGLLFFGKGTAESVIADIFGFGMNNKDILAVIVPVEKLEKTVEDINQITGIEHNNYGLTMVLPISSASSLLLDLTKINLSGESYGKN